VPRLTTIAALVTAAALLCACSDRSAHDAARAIGDPDRGAALTRSYGCVACHQIPGVLGAQGRVGPPLTQMARRTTIAGVLPNTPSNMIRWLRNPQTIVPGNAMPNMELTDHDARDIAAYLATLR
jgi:cytochrome c2